MPKKTNAMAEADRQLSENRARLLLIESRERIAKLEDAIRRLEAEHAQARDAENEARANRILGTETAQVEHGQAAQLEADLDAARVALEKAREALGSSADRVFEAERRALQDEQDVLNENRRNREADVGEALAGLYAALLASGAPVRAFKPDDPYDALRNMLDVVRSGLLPLVEPFAASVQARIEKKSLEDLQSGHAHDVQAQADLNRRRTALERAGTKRLLAEPA